MENAEDDEGDEDNERQRGPSPLNSTGGFLIQRDFPQSSNQQMEGLMSHSEHDSVLASDSRYEISGMPKLEADGELGTRFDGRTEPAGVIIEGFGSNSEQGRALVSGMRLGSSNRASESVWSRNGRDFHSVDGGNSVVLGSQQGNTSPEMRGDLERTGRGSTLMSSSRFDFSCYNKTS